MDNTTKSKSNRKHILRRALGFVGILMAVLVIGLVIVFRLELATLLSLRQVDAHPLYTMTYAGDYGFDGFLQTGAQTDADIERYVVKRLLRGVDIRLHIAGAGCSAFTARNAAGERLFARNFDFDFSPALFLQTKPDHGYASAGMVNLAYAGFGESNLPVPLSFGSFLTLAGPYLPFDGMNEKGLAMALLAVPHAEPPQTGAGAMLNTTTMIRLVLDQAATVQEALALLEEHPLYFSGGVPCHYLLADAAGDSAVAEYLDGALCVTKTDAPWQALTNFIVYQGRNEGEDENAFARYETIAARLDETGGVLSETEAMALLGDVRIPGRIQWSLVYNLTTGAVTACMGGRYDATYVLAGAR